VAFALFAPAHNQKPKQNLKKNASFKNKLYMYFLYPCKGDNDFSQKLATQ